MARPLGFISDSSWNPYTGCTRGAIGRRVTRGGPHPQNARAGTNDCCCRTPAATRAASGSPPPTPSSAAATEASFAAATEALSAATPLPLTCAGGAAAAPPAPPGSARAHSAYLPRLRREPRGSASPKTSSTCARAPRGVRLRAEQRWRERRERGAMHAHRCKEVANKEVVQDRKRQTRTTAVTKARSRGEWWSEEACCDRRGGVERPQSGKQDVSLTGNRTRGTAGKQRRAGRDVSN